MSRHEVGGRFGGRRDSAGDHEKEEEYKGCGSTGAATASTHDSNNKNKKAASKAKPSAAANARTHRANTRMRVMKLQDKPLGKPRCTTMEASVNIRAFVLAGQAATRHPSLARLLPSACNKAAHAGAEGAASRIKIQPRATPVAALGNGTTQATGAGPAMPARAHSATRTRAVGPSNGAEMLTLQGDFPAKPCRDPHTVVEMAQALGAHVSARFDGVLRQLTMADAAQPSAPASGTGRSGVAGAGAGDAGQYMSMPEGVEVQVVDTLVLARKAVKRLLSSKWRDTRIPGHGVVGIDTEWMPSTHDPTALMQVASMDAVFLFDLPKLHKNHPAKWPILARRLLMARNVLKTGYGLEGDLERLASTYPETTCYRCACQVLDTRDLWQHQLGALPTPSSTAAPVLPGLRRRRKNGRRGLALLVYHAFGVDLDKRQQCSCWNQRPLSDAQIRYAALDAHVLLQLFRHTTAVQVPKGSSAKSANSWTQWCRTFHYYDTRELLMETAAPDALVRSLARASVAVPEGAGYLRSPHALMSMQDAVSFLTHVQRCNPVETPAPALSPSELLPRLVKTVALIVESRGAVVSTQPPSAVVPVLMVTGGDQQVDPNRVLAALRRLPSCPDAIRANATIRKARFTECASVFGYEAGRIAPFARTTDTGGHVTGGDAATDASENASHPPAVVLVDALLTGEVSSSAISVDDYLYCGVGEPDVLLRMSPAALVTMTRGTVVDLSMPPTAAAAVLGSAGAINIEARAPTTPRPRSAADHSRRPVTGTATPTRGPREQFHSRAARRRARKQQQQESGNLSNALTAVEKLDKAGWGRRHIQFSFLDGGEYRCSANGSSTAGASSSDTWDDASNAEVLVGVARMLTDNGLHGCPVLRNMIKVHLALLYGPCVRLPPATRIMTDFLTRTQPFLCNGIGNFALRVLSFVAYKCHARMPNIAFTSAQPDEDGGILAVSSAAGAGAGASAVGTAAPGKPKPHNTRHGASFENSAARLLGVVLSECANPGALGAAIAGVRGAGDAVVDLETGTPVDAPLPSPAEVEAVMAQLSERHHTFLRRMTSALRRCRASVLKHVVNPALARSAAAGGNGRDAPTGAPSSTPSPSEAVQRQTLLAACDLLQDVARAGNMYVQHVVGDYSKSRGGSFWQVLTCMSLAATAVEVIAALLVHATPGHGRSLVQQIGITRLQATQTLKRLLTTVPDEGVAAPASAAPAAAASSAAATRATATVTVGEGASPMAQPPQQYVGHNIVAHTLRRAGFVIGSPTPLFRHIGKRLGRKVLRGGFETKTK